MDTRYTDSYLAFWAHTDPLKAKERFREKYGIEPEKTIKTSGALLLGPIPARKEHRPLPENPSSVEQGRLI